jgi:hypothetical protein
VSAIFHTYLDKICKRKSVVVFRPTVSLNSLENNFASERYQLLSHCFVRLSMSGENAAAKPQGPREGTLELFDEFLGVHCVELT